MSKIGLIDVDHHNFPNIALMKISAWHKKIGNTVEWYTPFEHYDIVYVSKVFSFSEDWREPINAKKVIYGGTGYQIWKRNGKEVFDYIGSYDIIGKIFISKLPDIMEHIYPDYSIYPMYTKDTAYGFLTRGCPRGCTFCHVQEKEGMLSHKVADLSEFWRGQKNIVLCDPNILACKEWKPLLQQLIDSKANVDFNQGLDIRLMTEKKAQMITDCKIDQIHFAWDRYEDGKIIIPKLKLFREVYERKKKWNEHGKIVFVLVNFDTTPEQDLERIYILRELGYWAFVMIYDKENFTDRFYKDLARWVNNRKIFAVCKTFEEYQQYMRTNKTSNHGKED